MKRQECPKCKSKDLSDGENDYLIVNGIEVPFQFCNNCHTEWWINRSEDQDAKLGETE